MREAVQRESDSGVAECQSRALKTERVTRSVALHFLRKNSKRPAIMFWLANPSRKSFQRIKREFPGAAFVQRA